MTWQRAVRSRRALGWKMATSCLRRALIRRLIGQIYPSTRVALPHTSRLKRGDSFAFATRHVMLYISVPAIRLLVSVYITCIVPRVDGSWNLRAEELTIRCIASNSSVTMSFH